MAAFFQTLVASEPDFDGDIGFESELTISNETDQVIHRIYINIFYSDTDGATVGESSSEEDVFLEPGETYTYAPWGGINKRDILGNEIIVKALTRLARRDFRLLGEMPIPEIGCVSRLSTQLDLYWHSGPLVIHAIRTNPDRDGDSSIEFRTLIENKSTQFVEAVTLRVQLIDGDGVEIECLENTTQVPLGSSTMLNVSAYRSRTIKSGKAILTIKAFIQEIRYMAFEKTQIGGK